MGNLHLLAALPMIPAAMRQIMVRTMLAAADAGLIEPTEAEVRAIYAGACHPDQAIRVFQL